MMTMTMMMIMMIVLCPAVKCKRWASKVVRQPQRIYPIESADPIEGFTGELPHGPYCCEAEYQGCCARAYGDLDARCVNRTSDPWEINVNLFVLISPDIPTSPASTRTCYKTEMMSDTSTSLGFLYSMSTSLFDETLPDPNLRIHLLKFVRWAGHVHAQNHSRRWNDQDLPELYDVLTNLTIPTANLL